MSDCDVRGCGRSRTLRCRISRCLCKHLWALTHIADFIFVGKVCDPIGQLWTVFVIGPRRWWLCTRVQQNGAAERNHQCINIFVLLFVTYIHSLSLATYYYCYTINNYTDSSSSSENMYAASWEKGSITFGHRSLFWPFSLFMREHIL